MLEEQGFSLNHSCANRAVSYLTENSHLQKTPGTVPDTEGKPPRQRHVRPQERFLCRKVHVSISGVCVPEQ